MDQWLAQQLTLPTSTYLAPANYPPPLTTIHRQPLPVSTADWFPNPQILRGTGWPPLDPSQQAPTRHMAASPSQQHIPPPLWPPVQPPSTTYPQVPQPGPLVHFYPPITDTTRRKQLPYPPFKDSKDPDAHVWVFLTTAQANRETNVAELINLFRYSLREGASEWFSNYITDFPNTTFNDLITAFRKRYRMINSEEKAYKQLHQLIQQPRKKIEVYYERLMKIANLLEMKHDDHSFITYFRLGLLPHLKIATVGMARSTLRQQLQFALQVEEGLSESNYIQPGPQNHWSPLNRHLFVDFCNKPGHGKGHCWRNPANPNNRLNEIRAKVAMVQPSLTNPRPPPFDCTAYSPRAPVSCYLCGGNHLVRV